MLYRSQKHSFQVDKDSPATCWLEGLVVAVNLALQAENFLVAI